MKVARTVAETKAGITALSAPTSVELVVVSCNWARHTLSGAHAVRRCALKAQHRVVHLPMHSVPANRDGSKN